MKTRPIGILKINRKLLAELLRQDCDRQIVLDGVPADARILGVSEDYFFDTDCIAIKIESEQILCQSNDDCVVPIIHVTAIEVRPEVRRVMANV